MRVRWCVRYGLVGPDIESRWGARFSASFQAGYEDHPASYTMDTGSFPRVKRPGRGVDHPPHLAQRLKSRAVALLPLWTFVACSRVTFTFTLVCAHRDLFWLTRKFGVKTRKPCRTVQYIGSAACGTDVPCCLLKIRLQCHSAAQYEALWKMQKASLLSNPIFRWTSMCLRETSPTRTDMYPATS
jgi:hypothetical protein